MSDFKWKDGSQSDIITSGLDSLADGGRAISDAIDNDTGLDMYADIEYEVRYTSSAPAAGVKVADIYLLPTIDGTNYPEGSTSLDPQKSLLVGSLESRNGSTSAIERLVLPGVPLPPRDYKVLLKNTSGKTLHSTANIVSIRPFKLQSV